MLAFYTRLLRLHSDGVTNDTRAPPFMILVPFFDLKFLNELAAGGAGTSIGGTGHFFLLLSPIVSYRFTGAKSSVSS